MPVVLSDDFVKASHLTESEIKQELAIILYQKKKISLAKAASLLNMNRLEFQKLLAEKKIPINFDISDFDKDIETLKKLRLM